MLVEIDNKIISTEIFEKHFVCDLKSCKGSCCIEGDSGAPLNTEDINQIKLNLEKIQRHLSALSVEKIKDHGFYKTDVDDENVTLLMDDGACVFASKNDMGVYSCSIEQANTEFNFGFKKPLSCHLYPIRIKELKNYIGLNYDKWSICSSACILGNDLQVKVFEFLKEPIERAFGKKFYEQLKVIDKEINESK